MVGLIEGVGEILKYSDVGDSPNCLEVFRVYVLARFDLVLCKSVFLVFDLDDWKPEQLEMVEVFRLLSFYFKLAYEPRISIELRVNEFLLKAFLVFSIMVGV